MPELNVVAGKLSVVIEAANGIEADYFVEVLPPVNGAEWAVRLTHLAEPSRCYVVQKFPGAWRCNCKDYQCRPARRIEGCKHVQTARAVRELLAALRGEAHEPQ